MLYQNREGPKLGGVVGRVSGTVSGFLYSAALKKAAVKWDVQSLDKWLTNPATLVPMSNMYFHVAKAQPHRLSTILDKPSAQLAQKSRAAAGPDLLSVA